MATHVYTDVKINPSQIERILAIHMGGIGNVILFTPGLQALRDAFPNTFISLLVARWGAEKVVEGSSLVDEVLVYDNRWGLLKKIEFIRMLGRKEFDLTVTATGINPLKAGMLTYLSGAPYRIGEDRGWNSFLYTIKSSYDDQMHEVDANLNIIKTIGIEVRNKNLFMSLSDADRGFADTFLKNDGVRSNDFLVGIHPGSGRYQAHFRRWSKYNFAKLADALIQNYGAKFIIFGGIEEISLANDLSELMKEKPIIATGKTTLHQAAALIKRCRLFITNDSGLMHLACAVNIPVVAIWGPTNYKKTGPYSNSAVIIRKELDCSPCYKREKVKCKELDCFRLITVEEVLEAVKIIWERDNKKSSEKGLRINEKV